MVRRGTQSQGERRLALPAGKSKGEIEDLIVAPVRYHLGKFPPQRFDLNRLMGLLGSARANIGAYEATIADTSDIEMFFHATFKTRGSLIHSD